MSDSTVAAYQQALDKRDAVTRQIQELVQSLRDVNAAMSRWDMVTVENNGNRFPQELAGKPGGPKIDGKKYPSIQDIESKLLEYHKVKQEIRNAWAEIPHYLKSVLINPPD